jgi:hypothetical protein
MSIVDDFENIGRRLRDLTECSKTSAPECSECEGGGWIAYGIGHSDPHFRECDVCHNPKGNPSP